MRGIGSGKESGGKVEKNSIGIKKSKMNRNDDASK